MSRPVGVAPWRRKLWNVAMTTRPLIWVVLAGLLLATCLVAVRPPAGIEPQRMLVGAARL